MFKKILRNFNLVKVNYQGRETFAIGGVIIAFSSLLLFFVYPYFINRPGLMIEQLLYLLVLVAALGFLDDIAGSKEQQGFRGHFASFLSGCISTGFLKAIFSLFTIILVILANGISSYPLFFLDLGILLLMTNFLNLLDLRPARAIKFFLIVSLLPVIILPGLSLYFIPVYMVIILYLPFELNSILMLGDTGANYLGALLGFSITFINNNFLKSLILIFLLMLTVISEKYSFTQFIERNKVLRYIDLLGREAE